MLPGAFSLLFRMHTTSLGFDDVSDLSLRNSTIHYCRDGRDLRDVDLRDGREGICKVTLTVKPTRDARQWVTTDLTTERQWLSGYQH